MRVVFKKAKLARRHIRPRKPESFVGNVNRRDIVVIFFGKKAVLDNRARSDDAHDVAVELFSFLRFFGSVELLANRNLKAAVDKFFNVIIDRMIRHAAHRRALFKPAVAPGKRQVQKIGRGYGVVEKHFVKIAEAE